ncbi:Helicase associated domain protein [Streptomyces sp. NBC_01218]|uniref:DEAD/DEAH box helicase n=1 Tax=Streptomyces sp. NBC_01218 TaxID=2903780 RepID=UPI002E13A7B3|nr:Helicase associated domain protein [Streptomyces sp. NBC_01218]WSQ55159.1 Helicase associated domain protein [Streptomyces sp. NBC_01218]
MTGGIPLYPHQAEAVDAIVAGLGIRPGQQIPKNGLRGQVHAACGTGKTFIAAGAAQRISPHGRVLVLLPTLELLAQTVREWRSFGRSGPMVAVCSMDDDPRLYDLRVPSTTNAQQLALYYGSGPVTVFATYASLPVLVEAHEGAYGLPMDVWDLVCVDEAHRTSGSLGKAWAVVHDQEQMPVMRRLYLTATPRIWRERSRPRWNRRGEGPAPVDRLPKEMACSMSDERIYGPVLWALDLSDAIARGLLARYQIVVVELRDERLTLEKLYGEERFEEHVRGERLAVLQAALLETMAEHGLERCITFHHRTVEAQAFSVGLERVAGRLHAADPERHPAQVWSGWLSGEHEPEMRAQELYQFGARVGRAVMSNCRVLGEGVDCPSVDSVALIDPKGSAVDIVQAIGRALRQKPGQDKLATLIVPVFLGPDETPEDMPYSASYRPLLKVLSGLRAHDERAVEMLAIPSEDLNRTKPVSSWLGPAPEGDDEEEERLLLRFGVHRDPALVARMVEYNLIEPEHANWRAGHRAAVAYREREGDLAVPYNWVEGGDERGEGGFPLGRWLSDQRRAMRAGTLLPERAEDLEALDIVWDPADAAWEENLSAAKAYFAAYGTLAAPVTAMIMDRPVGQWLANARKKNGLGKDVERAQRRAAALAAIDPDWNPDWPVDWQRHCAALKGFVVPGSVLGYMEPGVMVNGLDVGRWLFAQQDGWEQLSAGQRERLVELGVRPPGKPVVVAAKVRPRRAGGARAGAFERGIAALAQYAEREKTLVVPRAWSEELGDGTSVRLGVWLSNVKSRRAALTGEQLERLAGLGLEWAA